MISIRIAVDKDRDFVKFDMYNVSFINCNPDDDVIHIENDIAIAHAIKINNQYYAHHISEPALILTANKPFFYYFATYGMCMTIECLPMDYASKLILKLKYGDTHPNCIHYQL